MCRIYFGLFFTVCLYQFAKLVLREFARLKCPNDPKILGSAMEALSKVESLPRIPLETINFFISLHEECKDLFVGKFLVLIITKTWDGLSELDRAALYENFNPEKSTIYTRQIKRLISL
jgi:hypothetical protein